MEKKTKLFILSGILLASFFIPYINWEGFAMSGFDFVLSAHTPPIKYLLLAIPGSAIGLLATAWSDAHNSVPSKYFLYAPLVVIILLFSFFYTNAESRVSLGTLNPLKVFSIGLWITLAVSLVLAFRKKTISY